MQARTARFDRAVIEGGAAKVKGRVIRGGLTVIDDLPIVSASVTVDATAAQRRTCQVIATDTDGTLSPTVSADPLSPYGSELVLSCGFEWPVGAPELLAQGVFRITSADPDGMGEIRLTGVDRSTVVQEARHEVPYVIPAGTNAGTAIDNLVAAKLPGVVLATSAVGTTLPLTVFEEGDKSGDPWRNVADLAAAIGHEAFFGVNGEFVRRPVPNPTTDPLVWAYAPGADALVIGSRNPLETANAKNVAIVIGEGTGVPVPVRGVAQVTDPSSPLFPASFGRRPVFLTTPLVTTQAQADAAALALLQRRAGGSERLTFSAAPHPAHDAGDVVLVTNEGLGITVAVVLVSFTLDLSLTSAVSYTTQARRSA